MAFVKRTWKDRISEYPNRRTINDGNVTKQVTVGRDEGTVTEEGDAFDATNLNDLEERIEDAYGDVVSLVASEVAVQYHGDVIFDNVPTASHGVGYAVTSDGLKTALDSKADTSAIPEELNDLSDVDISGQAQGEALVWDGTKWVNGTVSTVGSIDDLSDVDTTGKQEGDSMRYNGLEWVAKPTTVKMTQAEYDLINDFTPYENTHIVITDAPNLNPTASDIEYSSGVSVADKLTSLTSGKQDTLTVVDLSSQVTIQTGFALKSWGSITATQYGKLIFVVISGLYSSNNIASATNCIELPKIANGMFNCSGNDDDRKTVLFSVNDNANMLKVDIATANKNMFATLIYLTY